MADLSPIDRLIAEAECTKLINRFVMLSDARDWDPLSDLFTEDGVFARPTDPANPIRSREAIRAAYHARPRGKINRHFVGNPVVDIESATTARGFSYVLLYLAPETDDGSASKADPNQLVGAFTDTFVKVDGVWKIKERIGSLSIKTA
ncbi:MAG: nuclear transport factor 2 family protein [Caulobacteraceae bacterium]